MRILFLSAEVAPFVSVGGLSQVMYFLPRALIRQGQDVRVFTPKYGSMYREIKSEQQWKLTMAMEGLRVPITHSSTTQETEWDNKNLICNIKFFKGRSPSPSVYFLENREYYELRANVFGYGDDHVRFALLSKGCLEWLLQQSKRKKENGKEDAWWPDIIHCNDWHTAYFIEMARRDKRYEKVLSKISIVLTVHNFAFQGNFDFRYAADDDRDYGINELAPLLSPKLQKQNALLRGIIYADAINTVSPTHAVEVLTPEYAVGLEDELKKIRSKLIGILNGLDTKEFDPAADPLIKKNYDERTYLTAKRENKLDLQKSFGLEENLDRPLFVTCGRISQQKGWDILLEVLPHLFSERPDVQLIVLGSGDDNYRNKLQQLADAFPNQMGVHLLPDFRLPRKLYAGADMVLIPSLFEPGGIVALEALRYGAVPIVRRTGGLNDIIKDFDPVSEKGNGFSFTKKDSWALFTTIIEALTYFKQPHVWKRVVRNSMVSDFSWEHVAKEYKEWYERVLEQRKRTISSSPHLAHNVSAV